MRWMRNACNSLVGKPERKRKLGKPWRRWEDNVTRKWVLMYEGLG